MLRGWNGEGGRIQGDDASGAGISFFIVMVKTPQYPGPSNTAFMNSSIVASVNARWLLRESNHMSLAEGLVHEEGFLHEDVLRIGPNQA